jgi:ABC-2 type transport system ATP-binding protein
MVMGLVGPNGAGKTTTMRSLAGIIRPTRGRLSIAGHDVVNDSIAAKRALAYVPDDPKLFDALTVWEHLEFIASAYRVSNFIPKGEALLEQFELVEKRGELTQTLSRGMRQKVAICCAYLHDPEAILFDEPLTGLDPYAIRTLKASIADRAAAGAAVVVSSHLLVLVEDLCTHLVLMLSVSNALFLIYPVRLTQGASAEFQMVGRMMLLMLLQFLVLIPALGIPAGLGGLAYVLFGFHPAVFTVVTWVLLVAEVPLWLFLLAVVFNRFDPGTYTPP